MTFKKRLGKMILKCSPFTKRTFDIFRFEIGCALQRFKNYCNPYYHYKVYKLKTKKDLRVNFGSGGKGLDGWVNIDARPSHRDIYVALDVRRRLPFKSCSVKYIFIEHVVEHLDFEGDIPFVLAEFYRILQPGGVLRIIVPDLEKFVKAYVSTSNDLFKEIGWDLEAMPNDIFTRMHILNHMFHQKGEHLFGYDFETLKLVLGRAGFNRVVKNSFKSSEFDCLNIDQDNHKKYSLYVDAVK